MKRPFHRVNAAFSAFFAIAILSACSGGGLGSGASSGGSTVPAQQSAPAPVTGDDDVAPATAPAPQTLHPDAANPKNLAPIVIEEGGVTGEANQFTPARGDSSVGGHGQTVDNLACQTHMTVNKYHVHAYLGVIYNDKLMADPSAIGMLDPQPAVNGFTNAAKCYYSIHTHDSSGAIHIEVNRELRAEERPRCLGRSAQHHALWPVQRPRARLRRQRSVEANHGDVVQRIHRRLR
jgi:hypothetical protein